MFPRQLPRAIVGALLIAAMWAAVAAVDYLFQRFGAVSVFIIALGYGAPVVLLGGWLERHNHPTLQSIGAAYLWVFERTVLMQACVLASIALCGLFAALGEMDPTQPGETFRYEFLMVTGLTSCLVFGGAGATMAAYAKASRPVRRGVAVGAVVSVIIPTGVIFGLDDVLSPVAAEHPELFTLAWLVYLTLVSVALMIPFYASMPPPNASAAG